MRFNGHKNWNHWNVNLWLTSDEDFYHIMLGHIARAKTKNQAAKNMLEQLQYMGLYETPDGAPFSVSSIRATMVGEEGA
jgi:hypothetical protein